MRHISSDGSGGLQAAALLPGIQNEPPLELTRVGSWQFCFMLLFCQIVGNLLLISPKSWGAERQASFCLSPPGTICPDETAGPLAGGSASVCPRHPPRLVPKSVRWQTAQQTQPFLPRATVGMGDLQVVAFRSWLGALPPSPGSFSTPAPHIMAA